jgi:hypothetical protein
MTADLVRKLIEDELTSVPDWTNVHGLDLTTCLIEPRLEDYVSALDKEISFKLWTVLEEAVDGNGYKITFDEDDKAFGLGIKSENDQLIDIGTYGTFMEALKGM